MNPVFQQRSEYLRFWGLQVRPFFQRDPRRFFCGTAQRDALFQVEQFIASGENVAILVGDTGCGMTRFLEYLSQLSGLGDCAVDMHFASEMPIASKCVRTVWLRDRNGAIQRHRPPEFSSNLAVLLGSHSSDRKTVVVGSCKHPRVVEIANMTLDDCYLYMAFSLRMAGGGQSIFTDSAIARMHEMTGGRIREFSQLAENLLWESWSQKQSRIGTGFIDQVCHSRRSAA